MGLRAVGGWVGLVAWATVMCGASEAAAEVQPPWRAAGHGPAAVAPRPAEAEPVEAAEPEPAAGEAETEAEPAPEAEMGEPAGPEAAPAEPAEAEPASEPAEPTSDAQFFSELGYKPAALASDAARALVILTSAGENLGGDFETDRAFLKEVGVSSDWLEESAPDDPLSKGHLATLICRALDVKGGLWMRLFGPVPRYALRECAYLDLMQGGAAYAHVSGGELVAVIDRADRLRLRKAGREPVELEGRPGGAG